MLCRMEYCESWLSGWEGGHGSSYRWSVVDERGGLSVTILEIGEDPEVGGGRQYHGGMFLHLSKQPAGGREPDTPKCKLTGGACWHENTVTRVAEFWVPFWQQDPGNTQRMLEHLLGEYESRLRLRDLEGKERVN